MASLPSASVSSSGNSLLATEPWLLIIVPAAIPALTTTSKVTTAESAGDRSPIVAVNSEPAKLAPTGRPSNRPLPGTYVTCPATGRSISSLSTTLVAGKAPMFMVVMV